MCVQLLQSLTRLTFFIKCLIKKKSSESIFSVINRAAVSSFYEHFFHFTPNEKRNKYKIFSSNVLFFGKCTQLPSCVRYPKETWAKIGVQIFSDQIINKSMPFLCNSCEPKKKLELFNGASYNVVYCRR